MSILVQHSVRPTATNTKWWMLNDNAIRFRKFKFIYILLYMGFQYY
jgi:hypothetical protein